MSDKPFSVRNEALRALNDEFKRNKDTYVRAVCLANIAIIELLFDIKSRIDKFTAVSVVDR